MGSNGMDAKVKPIIDDLMSEKEVVAGEMVKEDNESDCLLSSRNGGMSEERKAKRKVQWNDCNGNKLAEILEFQPSDASDNDDDDDDDDPDTCFCTIM